MDSQIKSAIVSGDQTLGNANAAIRLICYGDYLCPGSRELHLEISQLIGASEGKILYTFKPFPQPQKFFYALLVARAVEAAGRQNCYWPMHYAFFRYKGRINLEVLYDMASELGLDPERFHKDLKDPVLLGRVLEQVEEGRRQGVRATPALFINGAPQYPTALGHLRDRLERRLTAPPVCKIVGTVDPLLGTIYWGQWPEI
jgi:protein-disulfide isomerase